MTMRATQKKIMSWPGLDKRGHVGLVRGESVLYPGRIFFFSCALFPFISFASRARTSLQQVAGVELVHLGVLLGPVEDGDGKNAGGEPWKGGQ